VGLWFARQGEEATQALPEAPPVHPGVEAFLIPASDDRIALRGQARRRCERAALTGTGPNERLRFALTVAQRGLLAATALSAFTVVGLVAGRVLTKDEWADLKRQSADNDGAALAGAFGAARSAQERELALECFANELPPPGAPKGGRKKSRNASGGKKATNGGGGDGPSTQPLCLSSFGYGAPRAPCACTAACPACGCPPRAVSACVRRMRTHAPACSCALHARV
jgi:hypothetical protein